MTTTTDTVSSTLPGVNVLLEGPGGTGKTHSIGTLVESDPKLEVFYLALEPGLESLMGYWTDRGLKVPDNLHWHTLKAQSAGFTEMIDAAKKINTMSLESLAKLADPNKGKYNQFITLLEALNDFPDDRTGTKYGPVDQWKTNRALVMDGLTGLGDCAMSLVVGGKAVKSQSDWGIAQDQVYKILRNLTSSACPSHFVLLAHVDRETDQILGGVKLMSSTLGAKLAPKLPPMFSDVILTVRSGDKFFWDTASALADVKTRNLPIRGDIIPDFRPIVAKWKSRGGVI
jgi:hypothetical protein